MKYDKVDMDGDGSERAPTGRSAFGPGRGPSEIEELWGARAQLRTIADGLNGIEPLPSVAVVGGTGSGVSGSLDQLRQAVVLAELRRRMSGVDFKAFNPTNRPKPSMLTGEPLWPLGRVANAIPAPLDDSSAVLFAFESRTADCRDLVEQVPNAIWVLDPDEDCEVEADPIMLTSRLIDEQLLATLARYLRRAKGVPQGSRIAVLHLSPDGRSALAPAALGLHSGLVTHELDTSITPLDLAAWVASADLVVTDRPALAMLAIGFERPVLVARPKAEKSPRWAHDADLIVDPEDLPNLAGHAAPLAPEALRRFRSSLDGVFDDLATRLMASSADHLAQTADRRIHGLAHRVAVLEAVNSGLRRMMDKERRTLLQALDLGRPPLPPPPSTPPPTRSARRELAAADVEMTRLRHTVDQLQAEIDRIYATRVMRAAQPVRRVYARLRRLSR